jgi:hypothetical protein
MKTNRVIKRPKCISDGCNIRPSFNITGEKIALYCKNHKTINMVNVLEKRKCISDGCNIRPSFNITGEKIALYCKNHKTDDMFNVIHKHCNHEGCNKQPTFNIEGEKRGLYCKTHKTINMVNVLEKRKCNHEGCNKQPVFNIEGEKRGLYCKTHKTDGMIDVIEKRKCHHEGCNKIPSYNIEGEKQGLYCKTHKTDGMIDVIDKHCKTYLCYTIVRNKYNGYCCYCYINMFPDKPVSRNYKTKEYAIVEFIKSLDVNLSWISDKRVDGCSKRRPDLLLDLGYQVIIIEVDENQHIDYDCSCENKRLMELSYDLGHRPIIFIRFNPDEYTDKFNKKISSCWGNNKNGINVVKKSKMIEWEDRLHSLKNCVDYWINPENVTNKTIEIIQLFYDEDKI